MIDKRNRTVYLFIGLFFLVTTSNAQKLPDKQETGLPLPMGLKIDGKSTEWDQFQAYNRATRISYTLSNDNENLYLSMQTSDLSILNKLLTGSMTFTISPPGKKDDAAGIAFTYPVWDPNNRFHVMLATQRSGIYSAFKGDSIMNVANKELSTKSKSIGIYTPKRSDTLSVYNDQGIKAAAVFNDEMKLSIELLIPLKYGEMDLHSLPSLNYHIEINPVSRYTSSVVPLFFGSDANPIFEESISVTDFWGEYPLVKKQ